MLPVTRSASAMSDMAKIMAKARSMSDSALADVLAGKDLSIPQYAAMAEATGRRDLRNAVQGARARQQAQQPSVKDQLMMADAQEAGLAALPAPNMTNIDMASGGIVAFNGGGDIPKYAGEAGSLLGPDGRPISAADLASDVVEEELKKKPLSKEAAKFLAEREAKLNPRVGTTAAEVTEEAAKKGVLNKAKGAAGNLINKGIAAAVPYEIYNVGKGFSQGAASALTGPEQSSRRELMLGAGGGDDTALAAGIMDVADYSKPTASWVPDWANPNKWWTSNDKAQKSDKDIAADAAAAAKTERDIKAKYEGSGSGLNAIKSFQDLQKLKSQDYLGKYEGMGQKLRDAQAAGNKIAQGELLMGLASPFFTKPRLNEAFGEAANIAAKGSAAMRAERAKTEEKAMDFEFNWAKARELAEKGDMENALKFAALAEQSRYHDMSLNKMDKVSRSTALKEYNDALANPMMAKRLADLGIKNMDQYYRWANGLSYLDTVATLPGKDAKVRS